MTKKRMSKSIVALALAAAMALTGCSDDDGDNGDDGDLGNDVTTTVPMDDMTTTTLAG